MSELADKLMDMMTGMLIERELEREPMRFHRQDRKEKNRRLQMVVQLSIEYWNVTQETNFCSAFALDAIGAVFGGDWKEVGKLADMIDPDKEESRKLFSPTGLEPWRQYVAMLRACETKGEA